MSISSTPKPSLRPFFSSSKSLLDSNAPNYGETERFIDEKTSGSDGNADICFTDPEGQSDPQTGSPPRDYPPVAPARKPAGDNDFANLMQEISERKAKLFRSAASSAKKKNSLSVSDLPPPPEVVAPRKSFLEQVARMLPLEEAAALPDCVVLVTGSESVIGAVQGRLGGHRVFVPVSAVEVKAVLTAVFSKIHK